MDKFTTGRVVETMNVAEKRKEDVYFGLFVQLSLSRFVEGDWGDLDEEDKEVNDVALKYNERLMGVYIYDQRDVLDYLIAMENEQEYIPKKTEDKDPKGLKIYIITEWDRSTTTVLFPEDY